MRKSRLLGKAGKERSFLAEGVPIKAVGSAVARPLRRGARPTTSGDRIIATTTRSKERRHDNSMPRKAPEKR